MLTRHGAGFNATGLIESIVCQLLKLISQQFARFTNVLEFHHNSSQTASWCETACSCTTIG